MLLAKQLGKAAAHDLIEKASAQATKEKKHLRDVLLDNAQVRSNFTNDDIAGLFKPGAYSGMADEFVTRAIQTFKE